eukprot:TRINITY_DN6923_c0_g1_i6.p1 TRINITY_DN6923_c0_g1~~TRINITY_DN6923_c0_g1_i6.p1  ORF type:complete len:222 (-),score=51.16 TRINITY_DN6923_c0_g1_i6:348-1013(-)
MPSLVGSEMCIRDRHIPTLNISKSKHNNTDENKSQPQGLLQQKTTYESQLEETELRETPRNDHQYPQSSLQVSSFKVSPMNKKYLNTFETKSLHNQLNLFSPNNKYLNLAELQKKEINQCLNIIEYKISELEQLIQSEGVIDQEIKSYAQNKDQNSQNAIEKVQIQDKLSINKVKQASIIKYIQIQLHNLNQMGVKTNQLENFDWKNNLSQIKTKISQMVQ